MGAKIHFKDYNPLHNLMMNNNNHPSSNWSWYYRDNLLSDHLHDGSLLREAKGYSQYDKEVLKRMMLEHEAIFTMQVSELHRLYGIQKELMNELKYREQVKLCRTFQPNLFASHMLSEVSKEFRQMAHISALSGHSTTGNAMELPVIESKESETGWVQTPINTAGTFLVGGDYLNPKTVVPPKKKFDLHLPAETYIDVDDETISEKPCLGVAILSCRRDDAHGDDNVKLYLRREIDGSINESLKPSMQPENVSSKLVIADLNEPLEASSFEEEDLTSEVSHATMKHEEVIGHQLQSVRRLLSRDHFLDNHGQKYKLFCSSINNDKGKYSLVWPSSTDSSTNSSGDIRSIADCSHEGFCGGEFSVIVQCAKEMPMKCDKFVLPDQNKSDKYLGEKPIPGTRISNCTSKLPNLSSAKLDTAQLSQPLANLHRSDNSLQNQNCHHKEGNQSVEPFCQTNKAQHKSSSVKEPAFLIKSLNHDPNNLGSSENDEIHGFPVSEISNMDFINQVNTYTSSSSITTGVCSEGKLDTEAGKDFSAEEEIKRLNCNLTNTKNTVNKEADLHRRDGSHEAAENIVAMSLLNGNHSRCHTLPSTPSYDALYWFADFVASTELSAEVSREESPVYDNGVDVDIDMFESMTLKLKEVKDEIVSEQLENKKHEAPFISSLLLPRSRRGLTRKRRQRRDFHKDILPVLTPLTRHEVTVDLLSFEGIVRASGKSWKSVYPRSRTWKGENCRATGRWRPRGLPISVAKINIVTSPKQEINTEVILSWGRTTQRCHRQKVLPEIQILIKKKRTESMGDHRRRVSELPTPRRTCSKCPSSFTSCFGQICDVTSSPAAPTCWLSDIRSKSRYFISQNGRRRRHAPDFSYDLLDYALNLDDGTGNNSPESMDDIRGNSFSLCLPTSRYSYNSRIQPN